MSETKQPQACPKCVATVSWQHGEFVRCSTASCLFAQQWYCVNDWNRLRYVSEQEADDEDLPPTCGVCNTKLQLVRPGKYQCDKCDAEADEIERKQTAPKVRRMNGNNHYEGHWNEHDEKPDCFDCACQPVKSTPEKPRRMKANEAECHDEPHGHEHDENTYCKLDPPCQPVEAAPEKPRRMKDNPRTCFSIHHGEHEERQMCAHLGCQPVEAEQPAAPSAGCTSAMVDAIDAWDRDAACVRMEQPAAPDPGDGWRLLQAGETINDGDEVYVVDAKLWKKTRHQGDRVASSSITDCTYRRRVEPQAQGWDDRPLHRNSYGTLMMDSITHIEAPSLRGFMGFVYADGRVSLRPCLFSSTGNEMEFPVAVRFEP